MTPAAKLLGVIDRLDVAPMHQFFVQNVACLESRTQVDTVDESSVKSKSTHVTTSNTCDNHLSMATTM